MEQEEAEDIHHEHRRGGGAPTRGEYTLVTRRIASKNIYRRERREEKIGGRIGDAREPSRPAVLIWPSERDDTARRDARGDVESWGDPAPSDFISDLRRTSVVRGRNDTLPR